MPIDLAGALSALDTASAAIAAAKLKLTDVPVSPPPPPPPPPAPPTVPPSPPVVPPSPPVVPPPPPPPVTLPPQPATITTEHDTVPNFAKAPTVFSVRAGAWSDPAVWSTGRVPSDTDVVAVAADVVYDVKADARLTAVGVLPGGALRFRRDADTRLCVTHLVVRDGGTLDTGTDADPVRNDVRCEIVFNDVPLDPADAGQWGNGLLVFGTWTSCGCGGGKTPWVRLAADVAAGATALRLESPAAGWLAGDRVVLPDTRQATGADFSPRFVSQSEVVTVAAVSADGLTVTLAAPAAFRHAGPRDPDGVRSWGPAVGNLSRSVVYRSENDAGVRGHVLATATACVMVCHSRFAGLGRTTRFPLGPANVKGRYPLHLHHVHAAAADRPAFELTGNAVEGGGGPGPDVKWGVTVHASSFGAVRDNVVFQVGGGGVVLEDGTEVENVVAGNLVVAVSGDGSLPNSRGGDAAFEGAGFWWGNPLNRFTDNVAYDAGRGFLFWGAGFGVVRAPAAPGSAATRTVNCCEEALLEFARNECGCGRTGFGLEFWSLGTGLDRWNVPAAAESVVKDHRLWHVCLKGFYNYQTNHLTFDGLTARGNPADVGPFMVYAGDYIMQRFRMVNCDVQGFYIGFQPSVIGRDQRVEDSYFRNYADVHVQVPYNSGDPTKLVEPRTVTLRNVRHAPLPYPEQLSRLGPKAHVVMRGTPADGGPNLIMRTDVLVYADNGDPADNYRVYYRESAADAVLPPSQSPWPAGGVLVGCPEPNLTNAQAWAKYGVAFGGAVAPPSAGPHPAVAGLAAPLPAA